MADIRRSKSLSYWLRHAPERAGLLLDREGWASTDAVLDALEEAGLPTTREELAALVASSDKQRFELSADCNRIRARQGHSIAVEGDWPITAPPEFLYHGTTERFLPAIMEQGLRPGRRHHVHLSSTLATAQAVGGRRGRPVVLTIAAQQMAADGYVFRLSSNGVWLADCVPFPYFRVPKRDG